jgi:cholestenol Delta-isomerase
MSLFNTFSSKLSSLLNPAKLALPVQHPYYPQNAILPTYVANTTTSTTLVAIIFTAVAIVVAGSWFGLDYLPVAVGKKKTLTAGDKGIATWFILSGTLAFFFEGYFIYKSQTPGALASDQSVLGQLWKEYALSDSRYLTGDTLVYYLELLSVTLWGPLSFLAAYFTVDGNPYAKITQTTVAVAHILGDTAYYASSLWDISQGVAHSRPEPEYFWLYFIGFNMPWIIVPACKCS